MARRTALVTGARQGIGKAIACALADRGFDVAIIDLVRDDVAEATLAHLSAAGARTAFVEGDLAAIETHEALLDRIWSELGPVDALVNNAGIPTRPLMDILELEPDAFDRNLAVNLRGSFFLTQKTARRMLAHETTAYRSITFITSIAADHVSVERAPYCVSKSALSMTAKLYAQRLAPHIHVHEVRPGFIQTGMMASSSTPKVDRYIEERRIPAGRWGSAEDVGTVTATLASGELPYVSGQPVYVDGGFHLRKA